MINVMVKIMGKQKSSGGDEDTIELMTEGKLYEKENALYLVYEESEISGMEGCTTTLKLLEDKIIMKRFGNANSELVFQKGKRHISNYSTPYGNFRMEILTKKLEYSIDDGFNGNISLKYRMSITGLSEGSNDLDIEFKAIKTANS